MPVFEVGSIMIKMVFGCDIELLPIVVNHFILPKIVVMPSGEDEF